MPVDTGLPQEGMIYQREQYAKGGIGARYWDYRDTLAFRYIQGEVILDIGCGEGLTLEKIVKFFPDRRIWGVDTEPENIEICRKHGLPVVQTSVFALPFPKNSIDCVLFSEVIEHLDAPEDAIREIQRILKPQGKMIIIFPNDLMFKVSRLMVGMFREAFYDPGHVMQWTPSGMRNLLSKYDLSIAASSNLPFAFWRISLHHLVVAEKK